MKGRETAFGQFGQECTQHFLRSFQGPLGQTHTHKPRKGVRGRRSHRHSADTQAACSTSKERLARGLMTGGSYWTAPEEALWNRICVPVEFTCEIRV